MATDFKILGSLLHNTTTSYKFLFFLSLLELLKLNNFQKSIFSYREIIAMMVAYAWVPKSFFKLSLGKRDQIGKVIDELDIPIRKNSVNKIYEWVAPQISKDHLELFRYVPQRFIRDFFSEELRGMSDYLVDNRIIQLANEQFCSENAPIYKIDNINQKISLSSVWLNYLNSNYSIIFGWAKHEWGKYLQKQNPNSPAILNKLSLDNPRSNLKEQRQLWKMLIESGTLRCIYTNEKLNAKFHLDHFLPWKFLAHNQIWNLIPTPAEINLSKSDLLPDLKYLEPASDAHLKLILIAKQKLSNKQFQKLLGIYSDGIGIHEMDERFTIQGFMNAYEKTYIPLFQIAINNGFIPGWTAQEVIE